MKYMNKLVSYVNERVYSNIRATIRTLDKTAIQIEPVIYWLTFFPGPDDEMTALIRFVSEKAQREEGIGKVGRQVGG